MEVEGELYKLRDCAERVVRSLRNDWLLKCIDKHGHDHVVSTLTKIMRRRLGNESSGTFALTLEGLCLSIEECRDNYFDMLVIDMLANDALDVFLDKDGCIRVGNRKKEK